MAPEALTEVPSDLIRLREASRRLGVSNASGNRYALTGAKGKDGLRHVLRTIRVGGVLKTRPAWVAEFLAAINAPPGRPAGHSTTSSDADPHERFKDDEHARATAALA